MFPLLQFKFLNLKLVIRVRPHSFKKPPKNSKMRSKLYLSLVKQKIVCNSCYKKSCVHECDTHSDVLTELQGKHVTRHKRSISISEEETCTLSCFKEPKQHSDTVKLLLSHRQINSASACEPSPAEAVQAQCSIPSWSRAWGQLSKQSTWSSCSQSQPLGPTAEKGVRECQVQSNTTTCKGYPGCS